MNYKASVTIYIIIAVVGLLNLSCCSLQNNTVLYRWKRDSCGGKTFKCGSGECISAALVCDGVRNCEDRSDETSETCINNVIPILASYLNPPLISYVDKCPSNQFRCDNGYCISNRKQCDNKIDCSDGSDEKGCESSCRSSEYKCRSGLCVASYRLCDGVKDCADGSDETIQQCQSTRCAVNQFRCQYGACISKEDICDQKSHCADGSDESPALCKSEETSSTTPSTPPRVASSCELPLQPSNGEYNVGGCEPPSCSVSPGTVVQNFAILNFTCNQGFKLSGQQIVWCNKGVWTSSFPTCDRVLCPPLMNPTRYFDCTHLGTSVNCSQPMSPGTKATIRCRGFHIASPEILNYDIICQEAGSWSGGVFSCTPECGLPNPDGLPFVANGYKAKFAEFPWHVGIFKNIEGTFNQTCGGNLVSSRVVITAAHCFWNEAENGPFEYSLYRIVAGKYYLDWGKRSRYFQESEIDHVYLSKDFKGKIGLYAGDIAVVILKTEFQINDAVRPICLDVEGKYTEDFKPGNVGVVVGWGYTENQTQSEEIHAVTLPYVHRNECARTVPEYFVQYLYVRDKICVGTNLGKSVCRGDSGGGFAVKFQDEKQYFLMGIVSIGVSPGNEECNFSHYSTFTRVSDHYWFIKQYIHV